MRRGALGRGRQPTLANRRLPAITALSTRIWPASRGLRDSLVDRALRGTLRDLTVDGQTQTPDFRLTHFGLRCRSPRASTHGWTDQRDTWLEPVDATLGHSHFSARGQIVRVPGPVVEGAQQYGGHDIALTVNVDRARIEDFLRLASRSGKVLLTGDVTMKTSLHIPPGPAPVHERLVLNGSFALSNARFASAKIQGRITELSLRGQGGQEM